MFKWYNSLAERKQQGNSAKQAPGQLRSSMPQCMTPGRNRKKVRKKLRKFNTEGETTVVSRADESLVIDWRSGTTVTTDRKGWDGVIKQFSGFSSACRSRQVFWKYGVTTFEQTPDTLHAPWTPCSATSKVPEGCSDASVFQWVILNVSFFPPFCIVFIDSCKIIQEYLASKVNAEGAGWRYWQIITPAARVLRHACCVLSQGKSLRLSPYPFSASLTMWYIMSQHVHGSDKTNVNTFGISPNLWFRSFHSVLFIQRLPNVAFPNSDIFGHLGASSRFYLLLRETRAAVWDRRQNHPIYVQNPISGARFNGLLLLGSSKACQSQVSA